MTQVVLQPSANKDAREHYLDTIQNPVNLDLHRAKLGEEIYLHLISLFPSGVAPMWGVTPGVDDVNKRKWERMELGASVLFAAGGRIFGRGVIAAKFHNKGLATTLWRTDASGATWEYMYALAGVTEVSIPYIDFNAAVGYKANFVIQGFAILDDGKSEAFLDAYPSGLARVEWPATPKEVDEAVRELGGELERRVETWQRAEQSALREHLLHGAPIGVCALCGRTMDSRLLVAAHIKKRSQCTDSEKRDLANVGMLNCKFGCDELYERGFISISNDWTVVVKRSITDETVLKYISSTVLKAIEPRPSSKKFFDWHHKYHGFA
jgi:hypothetical protein